MKRLGILVCAALFAVGCGGSTSSNGTGGSAGAGGSAGNAGSGGSAGNAGSGATAGSAGTGGSAGSAGTGGIAGSGGSGGAGPECTTDADCKLWSDCCTCIGLAPGETPPASCPMTCLEDACSATGVKSASCVAGRCVAGYDCDSTQVTCKVAVPKCPSGQVPRVQGTCYTGDCVPAGECSYVDSCSVCNASGSTCAMYITQTGNRAHCVTIPQQCGANGTCACLGTSVCVAPYSHCTDFSGVKGVSCDCPTC